MAYNDSIKYRVYANGEVLTEDEFEEADNANPYYDDYAEFDLPVELIDHLTDGAITT